MVGVTALESLLEVLLTEATDRTGSARGPGREDTMGKMSGLPQFMKVESLF